MGRMEKVTLEDVKAGIVVNDKFKLSGWKISGNEVLDFFTKKKIRFISKFV